MAALNIYGIPAPQNWLHQFCGAGQTVEAAVAIGCRELRNRGRRRAFEQRDEMEQSYLAGYAENNP